MKNSFVFGAIGVTVLLAAILLWREFSTPFMDYSKLAQLPANYWRAPDTLQLPTNDSGNLIRYGRELIVHTSAYFGPKGSVARLSNGLNCQNCHLDAGTKMWGNNFSAVKSTYPKFRERSNSIENVVHRIQECFMRSLAGKPIDSTGREMKAMIAYMNWLGNKVDKGVRPEGAGTSELEYLDRAADSGKGRLVYVAKCQSCHQQDGQGVMAMDGLEYTYPPLWGEYSYNMGAGMYRLERLAAFAKDNMPFGASHTAAQLTDDEAWDVAAFINSRPRKTHNIAKDYPKGGKPIDYPFGPYADSFTEVQHKYGPFAPIKQWKESHKKKS